MTRTDLRAAHARRTRAAIRAAALALTRERGYAAMTVDDVAALAGVSRRTVFNHFSSKAELLVVGPEPPEPEAVEAFVTGKGPLLEDLGTLLVSGAQALGPERAWLMAFPQVVRDNPEVERAVHERFQAVERVLEDAASRRLGLPASAPRVRAVLALADAVQRASIRMWASSCGADDSAPGPASGPAPSPGGASTGGPVPGPTPETSDPAPDTASCQGRADAGTDRPRAGQGRAAGPGGQPDPVLSLADAVRTVAAAIDEVLAPAAPRRPAGPGSPPGPAQARPVAAASCPPPGLSDHSVPSTRKGTTS
ncbi:TetR/AcrR family transcriptional regulator [Actinomyces sp. oral taxon 897]|uniref:TetR/AcrR family transcriptional regulator n=1 Tax=Actinomyces sp. oral taxon 897 TaxID=2081702 RepID=UPI000D047910|nr:TetR family transcriptional regulator [Actinomyces sp. oral taxon 897]